MTEQITCKEMEKKWNEASLEERARIMEVCRIDGEFENNSDLDFTWSDMTPHFQIMITSWYEE